MTYLYLPALLLSLLAIIYYREEAKRERQRGDLYRARWLKLQRRQARAVVRASARQLRQTLTWRN